MNKEQNSKVYVKTDSENRIVFCDGGYTTPSDLTEWIKIDKGVGDRFNLCQSHYFEGGLYTDDGIPRYKLLDVIPVERTLEEIEADRAAIPAPAPTAQEQLRADVDFLAAMQGVAL